MRDHQCKRCGKYVKRGLWAHLNHKCNFKRVPYTKANIMKAFEDIFKPREPQLPVLYTGLDTYNLIQKTLADYARTGSQAKS